MGVIIGIASFVIISIVILLILIIVNPDLFSKKKAVENKSVKTFSSSKSSTSYYTEGSRGVSQLLAPSGIQYTSENEIKIENNYVKGFVVNGYPTRVNFGWMDSLYSYDGDMDVAVHIEPVNERNALDELTEKITQYESQLLSEMENGSNKNITALQDKISVLVNQRRRLETNMEKFFHVTTLCTMFGSDLKELNKDAQRFQSRLNGTRMGIMPLMLREDDGYKSCSPFGTLTINDYPRNMNTGALGTMFPFYNPEVNEINGTLLAVNVLRRTPIIVDLFNRKKLGNANLFISGASGSGKSYLTSLLIARSTIEGVRHCIIDPENEYGPICDSLGGVTVRLAQNSENMLNPFDIDEEIETDDDGNPTGRRFVDIKSKCSELLSLFSVMLSSMIDAEVRSEISDVLMTMYYSFGFNESVESLYEDGTSFDASTGNYYRGKVLKTMPTMSDFREFLSKRAEERQSSKLYAFVNALGMYCKGGVFDLFDCYSTVNLSAFDNVPIIRFDVEGIEDDLLRPIGMQIALSWAWNKFMKKDAKTKKRIICDEAWMLLSQAMAGSEYTAHFLENCARRVRKYNGSLCCASQNFREFVSRQEGQAILTNSSVRIFLKQQPEDIMAVGDRFILSDGEKQFLLSANRGEALMKIGNESIIASVFAFPFEHKLISKEHLEAS